MIRFGKLAHVHGAVLSHQDREGRQKVLGNEGEWLAPAHLRHVELPGEGARAEVVDGILASASSTQSKLRISERQPRGDVATPAHSFISLGKSEADTL